MSWSCLLHLDDGDPATGKSSIGSRIAQRPPQAASGGTDFLSAPSFRATAENWRGRAVLEAMGAASRLGRQRDRPASPVVDAPISGDQPAGFARGCPSWHRGRSIRSLSDLLPTAVPSAGTSSSIHCRTSSYRWMANASGPEFTSITANFWGNCLMSFFCAR